MEQQDRNRRTSLTLRRELVDPARRLAKSNGDTLGDFVRNAILTATRAAEAGRGDALPQVPPPQPRRPRGQGVSLVSFRYLCPEAEEQRCDAALGAAGSSLVVVAEAALRAYLKSGGSRLDTAMPGDPSASWRTAGAA